MKKFNIRIVFENNIEEFKTIEAKTINEAKKNCEQILIENQKIVERCKHKNVYTTRVIKECVVCNTNWRDELLGIDLGSKDNV